jgi:hypothetical protein
LSQTEDYRLVAPCGLYCGACIDYLVYKSCHGCGCDCGECAASAHHGTCDIHRCCVEQKAHETCSDCDEFPCSKLIQFCYNPVWPHHLPVIENLRRQKARGAKKWLEEQKQAWSNEWYLQRWLWLQKECEKRLEQSREESKNMLSRKK